MDVIRRTDLERLALQGRGRCVSVFLPTHRAGPEVQQGPIRLKNLLRQAIQDLQADGVKAPMVRSILAPLRRLVNDGLFWQYQSDDSSLVLALSQHQIRLLEGARKPARGGPPARYPAGGSQCAAGCGGPEAAAAVRRRPGRRGRKGIFHGHGSAGDVQNDQVLRYFRKVNRALREVLAGERAPMVLAAVEHLAPLWRQVTTYPHLVDQVLAGSPEELGLHELHARAWAVVEPLFRQGHHEEAAPYHQLAGTGRTSQDPRESVRAAKEGRVEVLFAAPQPTGVSSVASGPSLNGDRALRDVLELAAVTTLVKGGTVYALPVGAVPGDGSVAAVFRY
jgi:hypothetical protein